MAARGAIEILEESVSLLRSAPSSAVAAYLVGVIPFWLALLFFFSDMARSPFASEHLAAESLGVAVMFTWKSIWKSVYMTRLYECRASLPASSIPVFRVIVIQSAIQPLKLIAIPVGVLLTIPLPWVVAFFRNLSLFVAIDARDPIAAARRQAGLWTRQAWQVFGAVTLSTLLLLANVLIVIVLLPQLGRTFFGIEGDFVRAGGWVLNLTSAAVAAAITWLIVDPLLDAAYVLRCFYGVAIATGDDLRAALKKLIGVAAMVILLLGSPGTIDAQTVETNAAVKTVDASRLDRSIDKVIRRREFVWRAARPRVQGNEAPGWLRSAIDTIGRAWKSFEEQIRKWLKPKPDTQPERGSKGERPAIEIWGAVVVLALLGGAVALFLRRNRAPVVKAKEAVAAAPAVDLADEAVTADQLPEESWLALADSWLAKGDCRLAMRALYLAALNYLSERDLLAIRRWKTGLEYRRELERRARTNPRVNLELGPVFANSIELFERGWYGRHAVDRGDVEAFAARLEDMRRHVEPA